MKKYAVKKHPVFSGVFWVFPALATAAVTPVVAIVEKLEFGHHRSDGVMPALLHNVIVVVRNACHIVGKNPNLFAKGFQTAYPIMIALHGFAPRCGKLRELL